MREIRPSGSEGGGAISALPTPIPIARAACGWALARRHASVKLLLQMPRSPAIREEGLG